MAFTTADVLQGVGRRTTGALRSGVGPKRGGPRRMLYGKARYSTWLVWWREMWLGYGGISMNIPYIDNIQDFICSRSVSHISSMNSVIFNLHWKAWSSFTKAKGYLWVFNQNFFQDVFLYYRTLEESSVHWQPTQLWPPRAGNHWRSLFRWTSQCCATILGCVDGLSTHHLSLKKDTLLTKKMENLFGLLIQGYSLRICPTDLFPKGSNLDVSENNGTPKSSILIGVSIIFTIHFGVPLFLETPIWRKFVWICLVRNVSVYNKSACDSWTADRCSKEL